MKKVGKEFRKSLSAILAASMVMGSMPQTSLMVNAEEAETIETVETEETAESEETTEEASEDADEETTVAEAEEVVEENDEEIEVVGLAEEEKDEELEDNEAAAATVVTISCEDATAKFKVEVSATEEGSYDVLKDSSKKELEFKAGDTFKVDPSKPYVKIILSSSDGAYEIEKDSLDVVYTGKITRNTTIDIEAELITYAVTFSNPSEEAIEYAIISEKYPAGATLGSGDFKTVDELEYESLSSSEIDVPKGETLVVKVNEGVKIEGTGVEKVDDESNVYDTNYEYDYYYVTPSDAVPATVTAPSLKTVTIYSLDGIENLKYAQATVNAAEADNLVWNTATAKYVKVPDEVKVEDYKGKTVYTYTFDVVENEFLYLDGIDGVIASDDGENFDTFGVTKITVNKTIYLKNKADYEIDSEQLLYNYNSGNEEYSTDAEGAIATVTYTGAKLNDSNKKYEFSKGADIDVKVAAKTGYTVTRVYYTLGDSAKINELGTAAGTYRVKGGTEAIHVHIEGYQDAKLTLSATGFTVKIADEIDGEYVDIDTAKKYITGKHYFVKVSSDTKSVKSVEYVDGSSIKITDDASIYEITAAEGTKQIKVTAEEASKSAPVALNLKNVKISYATALDGETPAGYKPLAANAKFIPAAPAVKTADDGKNTDLYIKLEAADDSYELSAEDIEVKYNAGAALIKETGDALVYKIAYEKPNGDDGKEATYDIKKTISVKAEAKKVKVPFTVAFDGVSNPCELTYTFDNSTVAEGKYVISNKKENDPEELIVKGNKGEDIRFRVDVADADYEVLGVFITKTGFKGDLKDGDDCKSLTKDTSKNFTYTIHEPGDDFVEIHALVQNKSENAKDVVIELGDGTTNLNKYFAYVDEDMKLKDDLKPGDPKETEGTYDWEDYNSAGTNKIKVRLDQVLKFTMKYDVAEEANDGNYELDYATYTNKDNVIVKVNPDSKGRIAVPLSEILLDGDGAPANPVKVYEKVNSEKAVNITVEGLDDTLDKDATKLVYKLDEKKLYDDDKGEWTTSFTELVADSEEKTLKLKSADGYVITSVTVNGEAQSITEGGTKEEVAVHISLAEKKNFKVSVKTAPAKVDKDEVYAEFADLPAGVKSVSVEESDKVTYSETQKLLMVEKGVDIVRLSVETQEDSAKVQRMKSLTVGSTVVAPVSRSGAVFTYEIPASLINSTDKAAGTAIALTTEDDILNIYTIATPAITVDADDIATALGTSDSPSREKLIAKEVLNGKEVTLSVTGYATIKQFTGFDAVGNKVWEAVNAVTDDTTSKTTYTFTINERNTTDNAIEFMAELDEKLDYQITAEVNGSSDDDGIVISKDNSKTVTDVNVKVGDKVELLVKNLKADKSGYETLNKKLEDIDLSSAGIETKFDTATNDKVIFTISEKDAGKDIAIPLYAVVSDDDNAKTALGTVVVHVSPLAAGIEVKDAKNVVVESGSEIKVSACTVNEYTIHALPMGLDESLYKLETKASVGTAPGSYTYDKKTGEFVYYGASAEGTAEFTWVSTDSARTELFKLSFTTEVPELAIGGIAQASSGTTYVNIVLTPDKNIAYGTQNVFYKVVSEPVTGTDKPSQAKKMITYIPVDFDANGNPVATATKLTVADDPGKAEDLEKIAWNYKLTASLVLAKEDLAGAIKDVTSFYKQGKEATLDVATKNAYYEDNLSLKLVNKTAYTGQELQIAQMVYSDKASNTDSSEASYVVYDANGGIVWNSNYGGEITAAGEVIVAVPTDIKAGKYTLEVRAEAAEGMYQSRAKVNFTVKNGINWFETSTPREYAFSTSKGAKYTIKPVGYTDRWNDAGTERIKADKQKFTYEVVADIYGTELAKVNTAYAKNVASNVTVSKDGTVKVSKNFEVTGAAAHDTIYVMVKANDYAGSEYCTIVATKLTTEKIKSISEVYFVNGNTDIKEATTLEKINGASIVVKDDTGRDITGLVKLTVSGGFDRNDVNRVFIKEGKKPTSITVKATTTDGSKKSKSFKIKLSPVQAASVEIAPTNATITKVSDGAYTYKGSDATNPLVINIKAEDAAKKGIYAGYGKLETKVKGGVIVTNSNFSNDVSIIPTAAETTVTVTDKSVKKGEKATITLTNTAYEAVKAPKAKLAKGEVLYAGSTNDQTLTYNVTTDYNAVQVLEIKRSSNKVTGAYLNENIVEIKDGQMKLEFTPNNGSKTGTITYKAIYGNVDATTGVFTPATKAAEIKVSVKKLKEFKAVTDYTINYLDSTVVPFTGTPAAALIRVDALESANIDGKPNKFSTYFKVENGEIKLNLDSIDDFTKVEDKDLTGYVTYEYCSAKTANIVTKTTPIKINLDAAAKTYDVKTVDVMRRNGSMSTTGTITLDGKPVEIVAIKAVTTGWEASAAGGVITFTAGGTYAPVGSNTVECKIIPENSYYGNSLDTALKNIDKNGITVTANINVLDPATATGKIAAKEDKLKINLADGTQEYTNSKSFYSSKEITVVDDEEGVLTILPSELAIKNIKLASEAPEGITVEYVSNKLVFTAEESKITANSEIKVPVEVSFDNSSVNEEVTFTLVTPEKFKTLADVAAEVKAYLESNGEFYKALDKGIASPTIGTITDETALKNALKDGINEVLNKNKAANVTIKGDAIEYTDGKVTVTLAKDTDEQILADIVLDKDMKPSAQENADQVYADVIEKAVTGILDEGTVTGEDAVDKVKEMYAYIDYMEVSAKTTPYEIQTFLQKAVVNPEYTVSVKPETFKVTESTKLDQGSVKFDVEITVKGQKVEEIEAVSFEAKLKEYKKAE